jgi:predicted dehydrogenase
MPALRCGIIGTGKFATVHADAIASLSGMNLTSVCDTNRKSATDFAKKRKAKVFTKIEDFLKEKLDIVAIITPDDTHASVLTNVVKSKHAPRLVIIEKPLCMSEKELKNLSAILKKTKTRVIVDHSRRFNTGFQKLAKAIQSGKFGKPISVEWKYYAGWMHIAVHAVDTLRMFFGELKFVNAKKRGAVRFKDDPILAVDLKAKKFPKMTIHLDGDPTLPYSVFEAEIFFTKARLRIYWDDIFIDRAHASTYAPRILFESHEKVDPPTQTIASLYTACAETLRGKKNPMIAGTDFSSAKGTMDILFAAKRKARR